MTAWKKHYLRKEFIDTFVNNSQPYKFEVTNAIRLVRMAYMNKENREKELGFKPTCFVINDTAFVRFDKCKISRFTKHLNFEGGFVPLYRIKTVEVI